MVQTLREAVPATAATLYLNSGSAGPLLAPVARAMQEASATELAQGRSSQPAWAEFFAEMADLRTSLARYVGAQSTEVALTHNATEGLNIALWGLDWVPGDRIVTTTLEHGSALVPLYRLAQRRGVVIDFIDIGNGEREATLEALDGALARPARLVVISHVAWSTGAVLPVAEVTELAHRAGVPVLVDGAQAVGAISVDFEELDADFYAFNVYKWLCGPEGVGALVVADRWHDRLVPTFTGTFGVDLARYRANDPTSLYPAAGAARYEVGSVYRPGIRGALEALRWHTEVIGTEAIIARIAEVATYCRQQAALMPGWQVLTPEAPAPSGLVAFRAEGSDGSEGPELVARLSAEGITLRHVPDTDAVRISCGFFNTHEEVDRALALIGPPKAS